MEQVRAASNALRTRRELRESNLQPERPTETQLKALDASVKRNTALVRRLRTIGNGGAALLDDIRRTNQSKARSTAKAVHTRTLLALALVWPTRAGVPSRSMSARPWLRSRRPASRSRTSAQQSR